MGTSECINSSLLHVHLVLEAVISETRYSRIVVYLLATKCMGLYLFRHTYVVIKGIVAA